MSSRNRRAGHNWERECMKILKSLFPNVVTSRSESRSRDALKIDLINENEYENGILPVEFQCKTTSSGLNYRKYLDELPGKSLKCILHKYTQKSEKGRFIEKGRYAILPLNDFIKILECANNNDRCLEKSQYNDDINCSSFE